MKKYTFVALLLLISLVSFSQTKGDLTVTFTTSEAGGNYAPRNIVAIWVEDDAGNFVKTLLAYANNRKTHLNTWQASTSDAGSEYNTVDAITGATKNSHATRTCTWDGTDVDGNTVVDGTYHVWMELTDKNSTGNYTSFAFTKGSANDLQNPADAPSFSSIELQWEPEITTMDFAPIGATWHYSEGFFDNGDIRYIKIQSVKDTIIQNKSCKMISKNSILICNGRNSTEYIYNEDSMVFIYDTNLKIFQKLYNFSAKPNDQWSLLIPSFYSDGYDTITIKVDSVRTKTINNQQLIAQKVTYTVQDSLGFEQTYPSEIIENIGDFYYLFNLRPTGSFGCDFNYINGLRCYEDPSFGFYETGIVPSCEYTYDWVETDISQTTNTTQVYPNPTSNILNINNNNNSPLSIKLVNTQGQTMLKQEFTGNSTINLMDFEQGIYFLIIKKNNGTDEIKKIIKQ